MEPWMTRRTPPLRTISPVISVAGIGVLLFFASHPCAAQLEHQSITGGGVLTGTLENPNAAPDEDYLITLNDTDAVIVSHNQLRKKETLRAEVLEYRLTAPFAEDTVESHRKIAQWCRENKMPIEARLHQERIIELEPDDEQARKALGYEKKDGVWMTPKKARIGRIRHYGGKLVTPQGRNSETTRRKQKTRLTVEKANRSIQTASRTALTRRRKNSF